MLGLKNDLKLVIPEDIAKEYNYSLEEIKTNDKEILGYDKQISDLNAVLYNPKAPTGMLLGMQGSGKLPQLDTGLKHELKLLFH